MGVGFPQELGLSIALPGRFPASFPKDLSVISKGFK
jgi:hypothetical protein